MGQFAGTLFSMLLGWVQTAASWLWRLASDADVNTWLHWLLDHWLSLLVLLCIAGAAVDFLVYLIRWQPYRVWRSFLRRLSGKGREAAEKATEPPIQQRKWIFADGSTEVEEIPQSGTDEPVQEERLTAPIRPTRRAVRHAAPEQAYHQPVYPPQWQHTTREGQGETE